MRPTTHSTHATRTAPSGPSSGLASRLLAWALGLVIACLALGVGATPPGEPPAPVHHANAAVPDSDPQRALPGGPEPSAQVAHDAAPGDPPGCDSALVPEAPAGGAVAHAVDRGPMRARAGPDLPPPRRPPRG